MSMINIEILHSTCPTQMQTIVICFGKGWTVHVLPVLCLFPQVHVNYHPDKFARMQSVWERYVNNDLHALDK